MSKNATWIQPQELREILELIEALNNSNHLFLDVVSVFDDNDDKLGDLVYASDLLQSNGRLGSWAFRYPEANEDA